jgi:Flp pilus assembly CpaE family ATPase
MPDHKLLLVEDNPGDVRLVREMLAEADAGLFQVTAAGNLVAALDALAHTQGFDVALVDLSLPDSQGLETFQTLQLHAPRLPIVVLTGLDSESMALTAVGRGAQDYLNKNRLTPEALVRALRYAVVRGHNAPEPAQAQSATVVGFLGVKGGTGVTTIASHYAAALQRETQKKVLLVDLDVSAASASFLMKARAEYTVAEASINLHRLDAGLWKGVVFSGANGVDLLPSPGAIQFNDELSGERVRHVVRFARALYGFIVLDLGRLNSLSMNLLEETGELFVVATPELPSLYETARVLKRLFEVGGTRERTRLILNRTSRVGPCSIGDLETALGYPAYATLADCSSDLHEAYADGRFLDPRLPLHKQVSQIACKALGMEDPKTPQKPGLGLFRFARA